MGKRNKMDRNTIPDDYTLALAIVDACPVLLFGAAMIILGAALSCVPFAVGAAICVLSGAVKVLWKIVVVLRKENIWWMFLQMRIAMPIGLLMMGISLFVWRNHPETSAVIAMAKIPPALPLILIGIVGMILMFAFAFLLDSTKARSNWIEQITNTIAQAAILIGMIQLL